MARRARAPTWQVQRGSGPQAGPPQWGVRACASASLKPRVLPLGEQFALQLVLTGAAYRSSAFHGSASLPQLVPR